MQRITMDHAEIRRWAESRNGTPAVIDHPNARADKVGIRIDFPGGADEASRSITHDATWDEFFRIFDEQDLLMSFDDEPAADNPADWYRFEKRGQRADPDDLKGNPPADISPDDEHGPLGYEEEADTPEGDWPEGSEHN